jgi:alpha-glucosidase
MLVKKRTLEKYVAFEINSPVSLQGFSLKSNTRPAKESRTSFFHDDKEKIEFQETNNTIILKKELFGDEHVVGLGEKAFQLDRRRLSVKMWNTDNYGYQWHSDPLYTSIPFFISVRKGVAKGYFVDSTAKITFDIGVIEYDKILISVPSDSFTLYMIDGPKIEQVIESYTRLTGLPCELPEWALGHQVSRYSYFPQAKVLEIAREYKKHGVPISCIYLDIDYMEDRKIFTWDKEKFPNPKKMITELHSMGVKVVAILDPGIKFDQTFEVFKAGVGNYCETSNGEVYTGKVWPGECVFPDFLNSEARKFWTTRVEEFVSESDLDGIWLDMNEPSVFNDTKTIDENVLHERDNGTKVRHSLVHNAYAYFEAKATFEALNKLRNETFILTRAGCAGIQKFAAMWSGDNTSSWRNMRLQIPLLLSLSISGVPFVGCDIGGFIGNSTPELLTRFYQMACFFPIFRNHKSKEGNDQEPYRLPSKYREKIKEALSLRYSLLPYMARLALEAHKTGHPIIRPLFYEFQEDEDGYEINDQYLLGKHLLYAPVLEKGKQQRELYLPEGKWIEWANRRALNGNQWVDSESDLPLYLRSSQNLPNELKRRKFD